MDSLTHSLSGSRIAILQEKQILYLPLVAPTPPYRYRALNQQQVMIQPDIAIMWYNNHTLAVEYFPRQGIALPQPSYSPVTAEIQRDFGQYSFGIDREQLPEFLQLLAQNGYRVLNTNPDDEALVPAQVIIQQPNLFVLA